MRPPPIGREAVEALRPFRDQVVRMQAQCRPFGVDYLLLDTVRRMLDALAYHVTGEPDFFALRPPRS